MEEYDSTPLGLDGVEGIHAALVRPHCLPVDKKDARLFPLGRVGLSKCPKCAQPSAGDVCVMTQPRLSLCVRYFHAEHQNRQAQAMLSHIFYCLFCC